MAAAQNHDLLWLGGAAAAAFAAYEWLWKPYEAAQAAAALAATSGGLTGGGLNTSTALSSGLSPLSMVSAPSVVSPTDTAGLGTAVGSIVDPRVSPGGDVGQAMWRKNWTQAQAQARLDQIKQAYATQIAAVQALQSPGVNPAAAGIPAAQVQIQAEQAALNVALTNYQNSVAAKNTNDAAIWQAAAAAHQQDINELNARIAAAQQPVDNSAAIAAYQGSIASLLAQYTALTGMTLA